MLKFGENLKIAYQTHGNSGVLGLRILQILEIPKFGYFKSYYDERGVLTNLFYFSGKEGMFGSPNQGLTQSIEQYQ